MQDKLDPSRLSIDEAIKVLKAAGSRSATKEALEGDIAQGAPLNADGTINLVHLCAWLAREVIARGD